MHAETFSAAWCRGRFEQVEEENLEELWCCAKVVTPWQILLFRLCFSFDMFQISRQIMDWYWFWKKKITAGTRNLDWLLFQELFQFIGSSATFSINHWCAFTIIPVFWDLLRRFSTIPCFLTLWIKVVSVLLWTPGNLRNCIVSLQTYRTQWRYLPSVFFLFFFRCGRDVLHLKIFCAPSCLQVLFKWFMYSINLPVIRPGCGRVN